MGIVKWLLVDRFIEQGKIRNVNAANLDRGVENIILPWSGIHVGELLLSEKSKRRQGESSIDFMKRLQNLRRECHGKVVVHALLT